MVLLQHPIDDMVHLQHPELAPTDLICLTCRTKFRNEYVEEVLEREKGELGSLEREVLKNLKDQEILSRNIYPEFEKRLTMGDRVADLVASFGGSWAFILSFFAILIVWIIVNSVALTTRPFDPYPFILLNLVLSCVAAMQAPVIMMSQNRQEVKDRVRAEHDYQVNLKAEIEIRHMNGKLDQLLTHQWQRLLEIQRIQMQLMEDILQRPRNGPADQ